MEADLKSNQQRSSKSVLKAIFLLIFIVLALVIVRYSPVQNYLSPEGLGRFLDTAGIWAPIIFIFVYASGLIGDFYMFGLVP